ncbi:hypothetical protein FMO13_22570 [Xanthomonas phaseoli pv. dieffenbachiae]
MLQEIGQGFAVAPCSCVVVAVVVQMAALAPGAQVRVVAVLGDVIKVADGDYDAAARFRMRLVVGRPAVRMIRRSFAAVPGAREDARPDLRLPIAGVAGTVCGQDRHYAATPIAARSISSTRSRSCRRARRSCLAT